MPPIPQQQKEIEIKMSGKYKDIILKLIKEGSIYLSPDCSLGSLIRSGKESGAFTTEQATYLCAHKKMRIVAETGKKIIVSVGQEE